MSQADGEMQQQGATEVDGRLRQQQANEALQGVLAEPWGVDEPASREEGGAPSDIGGGAWEALAVGETPPPRLWATAQPQLLRSKA